MHLTHALIFRNATSVSSYGHGPRVALTTGAVSTASEAWIDSRNAPEAPRKQVEVAISSSYGVMWGQRRDYSFIPHPVYLRRCAMLTWVSGYRWNCSLEIVWLNRGMYLSKRYCTVDVSFETTYISNPNPFGVTLRACEQRLPVWLEVHHMHGWCCRTVLVRLRNPLWVDMFDTDVGLTSFNWAHGFDLVIDMDGLWSLDWI
jgi:hypothetical protein